MLSRRLMMWQGLGVSLTLASGAALAADAPRKGRKLKYGEFNPDQETVELFKGIEEKKLQVKLVVPDSTKANILITNLTDKPFNVDLPAAFAGVPVLAQMGGMGGGGMGGGGMGGGMGGGGGGGNQGVGGGGGGMGGGGMGGGGMGGGGMGGGGGGGGFFNVVPDKLVHLKTDVVCLEHGKRDPNAQLSYKIVPVASFNSKPGVLELCWMVGAKMIAHDPAQAAAWHLANGLSWEELAAKRVEFGRGLSEPYFKPEDLHIGFAVAQKAIELHEIRVEKEGQSGKSLGESSESRNPS